MHVMAIDELVDFHALLADGVEKAGRVAGENFADGGEAERGVEAADD